MIHQIYRLGDAIPKMCILHQLKLGLTRYKENIDFLEKKLCDFVKRYANMMALKRRFQ